MQLNASIGNVHCHNQPAIFVRSKVDKFIERNTTKEGGGRRFQDRARVFTHYVIIASSHFNNRTTGVTMNNAQERYFERNHLGQKPQTIFCCCCCLSK